MMTLYQPTEIREGYTMETVAENYVISDGARNLHISYVQPLAHVEGMLMAYLPKERIIVEADLFDGPPNNTSDAASAAAFYNHVQRLGLDVATVIPIHGSPVTWTEFLRETEKSRQR
jgi:hypothetical protein